MYYLIISIVVFTVAVVFNTITSVFCRQLFHPGRLYRLLFSVPFIIDCKTVGVFLKINKEIVKALRKSVTRAKQKKKTVFLASLPSLALCFQPRSRPFVWPLARRYLNTPKYGLFCSLSLLFVYSIVGQGFGNGARGVNGLLERADGKVRKQFSNSFFWSSFQALLPWLLVK